MPILPLPSKMSKPLLWKSFELHHFMFGYLYPSLLHMSTQDRVIIKHPLNWRLIPWLTFGLLGVSSMGILPLIYILFQELYLQRRKTSIVNITIFIGLLFGNILPLGLSTLPLVDPEYVSAFNQILIWGNTLEIEDRKKRGTDLIGIYLCATVILLGCSPLVVTSAAVIFNLDHFTYIFDDILPDPTVRESLNHIIIPFLIRFIVVLILVKEGFRSLTHSFILAATYVHEISKGLRILTKLTSTSSSTSTFFVFYAQISMANGAIRKTLGYLTALYIVCGQFTTVVLLWMTVNGYEHVESLIVFLMFPVVAVIGIAFTIIMFEQAITIFERSNELVAMWKIGCVSRTPVNKLGTYELKIRTEVKRVARAQRAIAMTVGGLRIIQRGFQIEYLNLLMDNFTNAMLLIKI
ncbi:unnamed protein product [Orchesella dallaii]|uniref:Gustatory receptor n=1 Tax=Orchesella dallaii TaxID=48710 RepID=A0ABP1Q159_9HEXA